jgi:hypothetical protein
VSASSPLGLSPLSRSRRRLPAPLAVVIESVLMILFWDISFENAIAFFFVLPLIAMIGWHLAGALIGRWRQKTPLAPSDVSEGPR